METRHTGRITEWNRERAYGFLEHDGRRLFLHARDFSERHKAPERGDWVEFAFGTDAKGRTCAVRAAHRNDGGRITRARLVVLGALLVAPALALHRLAGWLDIRLLLGWPALVGLLTLGLYWDDKRRARGAGWRVPEATLHAAELLGGWPVAFLAQGWLRHKVSKGAYQVVFWAIVALHETAAVDYLLGGRLVRAALEAI